MNTQALDALAALCGSAPAPHHNHPSAAAPESSIRSSNPPSSYHALIAQQLQMREAQQAAATSHQAQAQAQTQVQPSQQSQMARQAALATIPSDVLQAYLDRTTAGQGSSHIAPPLTSRFDGAAGLTGLIPGNGGVHQVFHHTPSPTLHARNPEPDPSTDARALAAKILMNQQQKQQQQRYSPGARQASPYIPFEAASDAPVMKLDLPHYVQAVHSMPHQYPHSPTMLATPTPSISKASHPPKEAMKEAEPLPARCGKRASTARPPLKKRIKARSRSNSPVGDLGGGKGGLLKKDSTVKSVMSEWENKKEAKRAANRLSAHLSRQRKKMFIDDLKGENEDLRRKEQILQSIPDLIIVFDSSGSMPFVSHSVTRFLSYSSDEMQDVSFWDILSDDSVRLIKSAFMDALAVKREPEDDSTPLWDGEPVIVRLVDKSTGGENSEDIYKLVSLKGVVHFSGESPECVCSIRPEEHRGSTSQPLKSRNDQYNGIETNSGNDSSSVAVSDDQDMRAAAAAISEDSNFTHQISYIDEKDRLI